MELHFVKRKKEVILPLSWLFPDGERKGQNKMDTESWWKGTLRKEFYGWSGLAKFGLNLIKWILLLKVSWYKTGVWFSLSVKRTKFSCSAALGNRLCEFLCL